MGFVASKADASLLIKFDSKSVINVIVYVDYILITGSHGDHIKDLIRQLDIQFSLEDLGDLSYFLGIEVLHPADNSLFLHQTK